MDSDRWKRINTIFHDALDLPPSDRQGFVASAAVGDEQLQSEIEALLRAEASAGSYLESPLLAPRSEANEKPMLPEGTVLCGRFRIIRKIAEGGMGQVYEATDKELGTQVAVKVIRPEIASDPAVLARFRQEVKLARLIPRHSGCRVDDRLCLKVCSGYKKRAGRNSQ
jgi:eukaryotic-like serine/threonine-protein kinase